MKTLATSYLGLNLKNPVIISSSGLTNSAEKNLLLERAGAGAIVLKSLFEEQINLNTEHFLNEGDYTEAEDYIRTYVQSQNVGEYLNLISDTKKQCTIPVIASINCHKKGDWTGVAKQIEAAGADAVELNIFLLNTDKFGDSNSSEQDYIDIVAEVRKATKLPVAVKIGQQFTNLVSLTQRLVAAGANSVVLFNRFYQPDIDLDTMKIKQGETFSVPTDFSNTLRWTALVSHFVKDANVVSSTGVYGWENAVKAMLAGAKAVEICSTVYKNGNGIIQQTVDGISKWMDEKGYYTLDEFRGKLNKENMGDPTLFERAQFMKYYAKN
jgi:dihydroorotate dehydrogenase (fumarate)